MAYAVYNNRLHRLYERDGKIRIVSRNKEEGFANYVDILGETADDLFVKEVSEDDLDFAYELWYRAEYFGHEFDVFSSIDKKLFEKNVIVLKASFNDDMAKLLDFDHYDRGTLIKRLCFDDIDRLIEVKVPILKFKDMEQTEKEIPKDKIAEHINNKLE